MSVTLLKFTGIILISIAAVAFLTLIAFLAVGNKYWWIPLIVSLVGMWLGIVTIAIDRIYQKLTLTSHITS
jgi:hypothetical protein